MKDEYYLHRGWESYQDRAPWSLLVPHVSAWMILLSLEGVNLLSYRKVYTSQVVMFLKMLHSQTVFCDFLLGEVREHFGAAANGLPKYQGVVAASEHELAVELGSVRIKDVCVVLGLAEESETPEECLDRYKKLTDEALASRVHLESRGTLEDQGDTEELKTRLEQEFFRAWKQSFPEGTEYTTFKDVSEERQTELLKTKTLAGKLLRPTYARNHLWRHWKKEESSTPAKSRDRWNAMSDDERKGFCPTAYNKIPEGEAGRDIVKKGVARAEKENKSEDS